MAGKNTLKVYPDPAIAGQSMAASFNGTPTNIEYFDNIGIQLKWTGANPIGAINVQVSLDFDPRFPSAATWTYIESTPGVPIVIAPGGAPGTGYFDLNQLSAPWVRVTYTTAGGSSGSLTSKVSAKGLQ